MDFVTAAADAHVITEAGHRRLRDELQELCTTQRDALAQALRDAREDGGDLADNAVLTEVIEQQHRLERRIDELETTLAYARVAEPAPDGTVGVGSHVRVCRDGGTPIEYEVVGPLEADPRSRRVSVVSPVGRALLGRSVGEVVTVDVPGGLRRLEILAVRRGTLPA